jgi:hypothetical protein
MLDTVLELIGRFLFHFFVEIIFHGIFHPIGWKMLKVLTLGRYPPPKPADHNRELVAGFPLVVLIVAVTFYFS